MRRIYKLCALALALLCLGGGAQARDFITIDLAEVNAPDQWARGEVEEARDLGLLTEHTADAFKMDITRFQFAELAVNLVETLTGVEIVPAPEDTFTDCAEPAALKAYAAGITTGTGDGSAFTPDGKITREQIAAMLHRAAAAVERETGAALPAGAGDLSGYTDVGDLSKWAAESVAALNGAGVMKGTSAVTLSPQGATTIQEAVILVLRVYHAVRAD